MIIMIITITITTTITITITIERHLQQEKDLPINVYTNKKTSLSLSYIVEKEELKSTYLSLFVCLFTIPKEPLDSRRIFETL